MGRKIIVSKFDSRKKTQKTDQRKGFKDHLKKNFVTAVGEHASVSTIIKQNYRPVLEMNVPLMERDHGYRRRDLY
jgi:hypothetical protein